MVVTPRGVQPQMTASLEHFKDKGDPGKVFPVFHCPVSVDTLFRQRDKPRLESDFL